MLCPKFGSFFSDFNAVKIPFELFWCPKKTINMWPICKMNITFMKHRFGRSVIIPRGVIVFNSGAEFILFRGPSNKDSNIGRYSSVDDQTYPTQLFKIKR